MKNGKIQIGQAGLGRLGIAHARNIAYSVRNAELAAICDSDPVTLARVKQQLGVDRSYDSFSRMLEDKELDAICIVTPSALHCEQIEQSLRAGFHVFSEKPLGTGEEDSLRAKKAVEEHPDKIFMLGFMRRHDASYKYAKMKIDNGEIGRPILFRGYGVDPESCIDSVIAYLPHSAGSFIDMSVHDIDVARWMLKSEPVSVYAIGGSYAHPEFETYGDGDNVSALMQFENDAMAFFYVGRTAPHGYNVETEIIGTKATLRIGSVPQANLVEIIDGMGVRKECSQSFFERFEQAYINEVQEFVDCILENRKPEVTVDDGVKTSRIAEIATKSFKNNELIKFKIQ